jgi:hypothetical protein
MIHHEFGEVLNDFYRRFKSHKHFNNKSHNKAAVILESRPAFMFPQIMTNASFFLNNGWNLYVFHTKTNEQFVKETLDGWDIYFVKVETGRLTEKDNNQIHKSMQFWDYFKEDHVLVFQLDTMFCKQVEDRFLEYDYIGAPCGPELSIMNGGFSLRKTDFVKKAIKECSSIIPDQIEDFFFSKSARYLNATIPDIETACRFSVESIFLDIPIGIHGTDKYYISSENVQSITTYMRDTYLTY